MPRACQYFFNNHEEVNMTQAQYAQAKGCSLSKARTDLEAMVAAGLARKVVGIERRRQGFMASRQKTVRYEIREAS